jgi:archaellum component FlaF (FlaF/FlaG flagellin family)
MGVASSTSSNSKQPYAIPGDSASLTVATQITKQRLDIVGIQPTS